MLEDKIDAAANGIKKGIGFIREHKKKIITGALVGVGSIAGIAVVSKVAGDAYDDEYLMLDDESYTVDDCDCSSDEIEIETTVEIEETED